MTYCQFALTALENVLNIYAPHQYNCKYPEDLDSIVKELLQEIERQLVTPGSILTDVYF